jgi:hypothetical protein
MTAPRPPTTPPSPAVRHLDHHGRSVPVSVRHAPGCDGRHSDNERCNGNGRTKLVQPLDRAVLL